MTLVLDSDMILEKEDIVWWQKDFMDYTATGWTRAGAATGAAGGDALPL